MKISKRGSGNFKKFTKFMKFSNLKISSHICSVGLGAGHRAAAISRAGTVYKALTVPTAAAVTCGFVGLLER